MNAAPAVLADVERQARSGARTTSDDDRRRGETLRRAGAVGTEVDELLAYGRNAWTVPAQPPAYPLPDEPFVAVWDEYVRDAATRGAFAALRDRLVQLRFPIAAGISQSEPYRAATRSGSRRWTDDAGLVIEQPESLRVFLHQSPAGRIPVIVAAHRPDFVSLLRALAHRNEPVDIPPSMGATMIAGFNNWDRVARARRAWEAERPPEARNHDAWREGFQAMATRKDEYQDRFIILSTSPYSGVPAHEVDVAAAEWPELSLRIRLDHECAHYFTRRLFGSMRNMLLDELLADYAGIVGAIGRYRADWFLRFVGLERFPHYREGGRLQNYRGAPALSDGAFLVLQRIVQRAVVAVESFDRQLTTAWRAADGTARVLTALATCTLEDLAADDAVSLLSERAGPGAEVR